METQQITVNPESELSMEAEYCFEPKTLSRIELEQAREAARQALMKTKVEGTGVAKADRNSSLKAAAKGNELKPPAA